MDFTIENYMNFCDEYDIADESFQDVVNAIKKAWMNIHGAFSKLKTFTKSLSHNVNYFKNASLPKKLSEDVQLLLQNLTPRREYINKLFPLLMSSATSHLVLNKHLSNDPMKDFEGQIKMSIHDVHVSVKDAIDSVAYKRLQSMDYDFTHLEKIPLNSVISKMKQLEMDITSYENMIRKININIENPKNERERVISSKMKKLYNALIINIELRCKLLLLYFKKAKASLKGTLNNIKNRKTELAISRDYTANKNKFKKHTIFHKKDLTEFEFKKFKELDSKMNSFNNDLSKYDEYVECVKEICSLMGIKWSKDKVVLYDSPNKNPGQIKFSYVVDKGRIRKLLDNTKLYHTSTDPNLKQLTPRYYFHSGDLLRRLWPTPRVYFAIGTPISNDGNVGNNKTLYTPKNPITDVYIDEEMGGTAVYVTSDKPIQISKEDFENATKNIDLPKII